jgi:hypothetical protein
MLQATHRSRNPLYGKGFRSNYAFGAAPFFQEFPQNFGALVANPFAFSVLLIARNGIARSGSIDPETSLTY